MLLDPDFVNDVQVIRRTTTVSTSGRNVVSEPTTISTIASVQPASHRQILRLPEAMRVADVRAFYIKLNTPQDGSSDYPDIIVYNSKRFQINYTDPWTNYGAGWCLVVAVGQDPS